MKIIELSLLETINVAEGKKKLELFYLNVLNFKLRYRVPVPDFLVGGSKKPKDIIQDLKELKVEKDIIVGDHVLQEGENIHEVAKKEIKEEAKEVATLAKEEAVELAKEVAIDVKEEAVEFVRETVETVVEKVTEEVKEELHL